MEAKLSAERAKGPALRVFLLEFVSFVRATFGASPDTLADFGLKPKKVPAPLTTEQKAAAAAKRAATRAARHTMGAKQKKSVKGTVPTTVTSTPTTATPPVAQPATPATHVTSPATG